MKTVFIIIISGIIYFVGNRQCNAQNLVPNPSFELVENEIVCGTLYNDLLNWYTPTIQHVFYFNEEFNTTFCANCNFCVPCNIIGCSYPKTGKAYVSVCLYEPPVPPYFWAIRAYIQVELLDTLIADTTYCAQVYLKLGSRSGFNNYATNRFGILLSDTAITDYSFPSGVNNLNFIPQIETPDNFIINDTLNWMKFQGFYKAKGGEKYITFGNFRNDSETPLFIVDTANIYNAPPSVHSFIDDVGLYKNECPIETDTSQKPKPQIVNTLQVPTGFTPNNDGKNDVFRVLGSPQVSNLKLCVYNRWGKQVYCGNSIYDGWDGTHNGQPCLIGTYLWVATYTLQATGDQRVESGNVTLMR
jgi:gliding motility-associated-like protein